MRYVVLALTVLITAFIGVATVLDMTRHGFSWLDLLGLLIVLLFATGGIGALLSGPRR